MGEESYSSIIEMVPGISEMEIKINGDIFNSKQLEIINILMTGNQYFDINKPDDLKIRLERAITASHDPLYKELLKNPLYPASVNLIKNWYLARKYSFDIADSPGIPKESELVAYYNHHIKSYMIKPERRASMIFIPVEITKESSPLDKHNAFKEGLKQANKIIEELKLGTPFSELAKKHSAHPSAADGGHLGWLKEPSFYEADTTLSKMKPGEVSDPVKSTNGYFIFQLHAVKEAKPKDFDKIKEKVTSDYLRARKMATWDRLLLESEKESGLFSAN
jgi:parvulin-like peptidyl-prolyl isomerase